MVILLQLLKMVIEVIMPSLMQVLGRSDVAKEIKADREDTLRQERLVKAKDEFVGIRI